jgi:hypothetical protein
LQLNTELLPRLLTKSGNCSRIPEEKVYRRCKAAREEWQIFIQGSIFFFLGFAMTGCSGSSSLSGNQTSVPAFSPGGGTYTSAQSVKISDATSGAVLYCTTDGTSPTASSPQCGQPTTVSKTEFLQAIAVAPGMTASVVMSAGYTINLNAVATPVFSPAGGNYSSAQTVTITDSLSGANIFYTIDGSIPTTASLAYTGPFTVSGNETVNAIAAASGYSNSNVATAAYTIAPPLGPPTFSPMSTTLRTATPVTINAASGATIYYTIDGSIPSPTSATTSVYNGPVTVSRIETINAIAVLGTQTSAMASAAYTFVGAGSVPSPTFAPGSGSTVRAAQDPITIADTDAKAAIWYTYDGSSPSMSNPDGTAAPSASAILYTGSPFQLPVSYAQTGNALVQAFALDSGTGSQASNAYYVVNRPSFQPPTFSPTSGSLLTVNQTTVTLQDTADPTAPIYYNIDSASAPTISSTPYTSPFTLSATGIHTIQAIAADPLNPTPIVVSAPYIVGNAGSAFSGEVSSAGSAITGAQVQLFAAGNSGYGSGALALGGPVTSDGNGSFTLSSYVCPAAPLDQVYLVATGGKVGSGTTNSSIALMTALGSCGSLPAGVIANGAVVNEVTTIASAYAMGAFATSNSTGGGINIGAPGTGLKCNAANGWLSTASQKETCNYLGLTHAFGAVNNLVNFTNYTDTYGVLAGAARSITPAYASAPVPYLNSSTVPQDRINALADMLASCVEGGPTQCNALFIAAQPPVNAKATPPPAPGDTLQAALDIAQNPGNSVSALLGLIPATNPPYQTAVGLGEATPPSDLTLALTFTGGGLGLNPTGSFQFGTDTVAPCVDTALAIDAAGNIWVGAYVNSSGPVSPLLAVFNNLGAPLTPATTINGTTVSLGGYSPDSGKSLEFDGFAFDQAGNLWVGEDSYREGFGTPSLFKVSGSPSSLSAAPIAAFSGTDISMAVDDNSPVGDVWIGGITGSEITPAGIVTTYNSNNAAVTYETFDSGGNLWIAGYFGSIFQSDIFMVDVSNPTGAPPIDGFPSGGNAVTSITPVADGSGHVYVCGDPSGLTVDVFTASGESKSSSFTPNTGRGCGNQLVLDGQGHILAVSDNGFSGITFGPIAYIDEFTVAGVLISPSANGYTGTSSGEPTTIAGDGDLGLAVPGISAAVDGSGNLWVLNNDTNGTDPNFNSTPCNVLVEYVGIGAPVVTPTSVALTNSLLGVRP